MISRDSTQGDDSEGQSNVTNLKRKILLALLHFPEKNKGKGRPQINVIKEPKKKKKGVMRET